MSIETYRPSRPRVSWRSVVVVAVLASAIHGSAFAAKPPPEPWRHQELLMADASLLTSLDELFALAEQDDVAGFKARFASASIRRLEEAWADEVEDGMKPGSWADMMAALVASDGSAPTIVSTDIDDGVAKVIIALDGRQHALYMERHPRLNPPWLVYVREREAGLNLEIDFAEQEPSIAELCFASGLGVPGRYVLEYEDDVDFALLSSLLITVEVFILPWLRVGAIYDLPLAFQALKVGGVDRTEYVPSRLMVGVTWAPIYVNFASQSRLEAQLLTYIGATLEGSPRAVPMIGARVALLQNAYEGAAIHLGLYYQGEVDYLGILYGVSYRF